MAEIIIVEDNDAIREAVSSYLKLDGHGVREFGRVQGVLEAVKMRSPDLLILDVMLPDGDGFQLAKRIRERSQVPMLFLTARASESDRITGFEVGGDDYVVKPFSPKELALRVLSILRRTEKREPAEYVRMIWKRGKDRLVMDSLSHRATINGREIALTAAEWKILAYLGSSPGMVVSRDRILGECLDYMAEGSERTVDTHIKNVRIKLGTPDFIETVRGFGYRFTGEKG
jgi:DNA-binding response OmpR family regulator